MWPSWRTILSALLIAGAFPPWDLGPFIWIALIPWLSGLSRLESYRQSLWQGFWLSFTVGVLAAHWLSFAIHEFLSLSWPLSILGLLVYAATCAQPQFLLFAPLFHWIRKKLHSESRIPHGLCLCGGLALCYSGLDWGVPRLFDVGLGYALHNATNLRQLADLGGVSLLSFLIVLVNLLLWRMTALPPRPSGQRAALLSHAAGVLLLCGAAFIYGVVRNQQMTALLQSPDQILRVGLAQGNISNQVRLAWARGDDRAAEKQLTTYMLLTEVFIQQTPKPDLVVWPEATFPGVFQKPVSKLQRGRGIKFDRQVLRLNVPIVFGAYDMTEEDGQRTFFNSVFFITPDYRKVGSLGFVQRYHKHKLLALAEYIPGVSKSAWLRLRLPTVGFFGSGPGAEVLKIVIPSGPSVRVAPILCSEALYPQHVIEGARKGGQLILNIGSDGWFGPHGEPQFHLAISRFRSIETRRPQVRAANTGISALILPDGAIARRSELGVEQILNLEVPIGQARDTLMVRWGDWFGPVAGVLAIGFAALLLPRTRS